MLSQVLASMPRPLDRALSLSTDVVDDDQKTPRGSESNQGVSTYLGSQILPWDQSPSGGVVGEPGPLPTSDTPVKTVRANLFYIEKKGLPTRLRNRLSAIAAFGNPDFYKAQKQRLPVWNKPRVISCSDDFPDYIRLPRGCEDDAIQFLRDVVAAAVIAARKRSTLILVHRRRLAEQWRDRLREFLDLPDDDVAVVGADKSRASGTIDVVLFQNLFSNGVVHDLVANYGHVIVD